MVEVSVELGTLFSMMLFSFQLESGAIYHGGATAWHGLAV